MLRLTRKVEYGLLAVDYLANHQSNGCVNAREIATQHGIPLELLAKVLQALVRKGVVASEHGAHGGYRLARSLAEMTLVDLVSALDGPVRLVECEPEEPGECPQYSTCTIREPIERVQRNLQQFLGHVTLEQLVRHGTVVVEV